MALMAIAESQFQEIAVKKAFEITYALLRVGSGMRSQSFAERLEGQALDLMEEAASREYGKMRSTLEKTEYFLRLAADTDLMHPQHAETLFQELVALYEAIVSYEKQEKLPPVSLEGIFSPMNFPPKEPDRDWSKMEVSQPSQIQAESESGNPATRQSIEEAKGQSVSEEEQVYQTRQAAEYRQDQILGIIRQSGNCRLKDIQAELPDTSERTLRYDLQNLIGKGMVERMGSGGPATSYRLNPAIPAADRVFQS